MPGAHLSREMKQCIVRWHYELDYGANEISKLANCSTSTVYDILQTWRQYGDVENLYRQSPGRRRCLDQHAINYISSLIQANPTLYLDEIQHDLEAALDVNVSLSTIYRTLVRIAISNKKISKEAAERDELLRATWMAVNGITPLEYMVWLDEASVDDCTNLRSNGWAGVGRACVRRATFLRGKRFSVLPALTHEGIIAMDIVEGSVNKEKFMEFLEVQLVCLCVFERCL